MDPSDGAAEAKTGTSGGKVTTRPFPRRRARVAEAEATRSPEPDHPPEVNRCDGPDPVRYGDWEVRASPATSRICRRARRAPRCEADDIALQCEL